ncbi:MAG: hypothetical protein H6742_02745 [Alphaproteobacteria bacterium]|nr:hypothetical protein [Alphaproteobacteria bacterium]
MGPGCGPRTDAERYAYALTDAPDFDRARESCLGIRASMSRGDCLVAAMERFDRLEAVDCDAMRADEPALALWRDECRFLLAERQRGAGALLEAVDTCQSTRFHRQCLWHLVQDEAEASLDESPLQAEARLGIFAGAHRIPDAAVQFWTIRTRTRAAKGVPPDERDCDSLADRESCIEGVRRYIRLTLDTRARHLDTSGCDEEHDVSGTLSGRRAWVDGPAARDTVRRWWELRCRAPAPSGGSRALPP